MDTNARLSDPDPFGPRPPRRSRRGRRHGLGPALLTFVVVVAVVAVSGAMIALLPYHSHSLDDAHLESGVRAAGGAGVLSMKVGTGLDERDHLAVSGVRFSKDTAELDVVADLGSVTTPVNVNARLVSLKTEEPVDALPILVKKPGVVTFVFPRGSRPWTTGRWRASLFVEAQEAAFAEFDIR
jgi:hypothetical protein